jgi:hydrogenase-4 membrane subunit HyfE
MTGLIVELNALVLGLFIIATIAMTVTRQIGACMQLFIAQSAFLAASAFLLGASPLSWHLIALGCVTVVSKIIIIPWVIGALVPGEVHQRRELSQRVDVPAALLVSLGLTLAGYAIAQRLIHAAPSLSPGNLAMGTAGLLVGLFLLAVRVEAVAQLLGVLAMENSAFLAGIAVAPDFPLIAELAIAFDVPLLAFIVALLARAAYRRIGTTEVGALSTLRERFR